MKQEDFLRDFYCTCDVQNQGNITLVIVSKAIRRSNQQIVDSVKTDIKISETNNWIADSQLQVSLTSWDWNKVIDQVKRAQLDYFAQRAPIDDYYPLNKKDYPDISDMYQ